MAATIYGLCAATALFCTYLLFSAFARSRDRLLFWSALCFAGLSINNALLVADKLIFTTVSLALWRDFAALLAMMLLLYGLIWHAE
jgi:hypothetical protein